MTGRVLVVVEQLRRPVPGGIGRYASALLDHLDADTSPPLTLLASRPPGRAGTDPLARWGLPVRTSRLPGPVLTKAWDRGVVHAPDGYAVVHAVSLAVPPVRPGRGGGHGAAAVVVVHDLAWRVHPEATTRHGRRWHEAALQRALRRADAMIVPSTPVADALGDAGASADRVMLCPFGADHLPAPDRVGAAALLTRLGVQGPYLLSAGTLEPRKNLRRLVAAYTAVRSSLPEPWPLVLVGPTGWGDDGLGATDAAGGRAAVGVVPAGVVSDGVLAALYESAQVFAYVPLTEGYGLPPLEAMTFGVPVVASTEVPSVAPEGDHPPAALRIEPRTVDALADALLEAATDEDLRTALGARGAALAASRRWADTARRHVALWESVAK